jgi:hypothetical protein
MLCTHPIFYQRFLSLCSSTPLLQHASSSSSLLVPTEKCACWQQLPIEIKLEIGHFLDLPSLLRLSIVNKECYSLTSTTPILRRYQEARGWLEQHGADSLHQLASSLSDAISANLDLFQLVCDIKNHRCQTIDIKHGFDQQTPLMVAAFYGKTHFVHKLIVRGSWIDAKDRE